MLTSGTSELGFFFGGIGFAESDGVSNFFGTIGACASLCFCFASIGGRDGDGRSGFVFCVDSLAIGVCDGGTLQAFGFFFGRNGSRFCGGFGGSGLSVGVCDSRTLSGFGFFFGGNGACIGAGNAFALFLVFLCDGNGFHGSFVLFARVTFAFFFGDVFLCLVGGLCGGFHTECIDIARFIADIGEVCVDEFETDFLEF